MKNNRKSVFLKYIFTMLIAIACIQNASSGNSTLFENNSRNTNNSSAGQGSNNSASNESIWGNSESTMFNNTANSGSRQFAPPAALPDEPGATCVPVPEGTLIILIMAFLYGLVVLFLSKRKNINTEK